MYKRIAKKQRRREEDEELGLDYDTKEALGIADTDSDESESESDSDSSSDSHHSEAPGKDGSEDEANTDGDHYPLSDGSSADDGEEAPQLSLSQVLENPIYSVSVTLGENVRTCFVCPGKILKTEEAVTQHAQASAHTRRFERFVSAARQKDGSVDPLEILKVANHNTIQAPTLAGKHEESKRAQKRREKQAEIKRKRDAVKSRKREKKEKQEIVKKDVEATEDAGPSSPPPGDIAKADARGDGTKKRKRKKVEGSHGTIPSLPSKSTETLGPSGAKKAKKRKTGGDAGDAPPKALLATGEDVEANSSPFFEDMKPLQPKKSVRFKEPVKQKKASSLSTTTGGRRLGFQRRSPRYFDDRLAKKMGRIQEREKRQAVRRQKKVGGKERPEPKEKSRRDTPKGHGSVLKIFD